MTIVRPRSERGTFESRAATCHPEKQHKGNGLCVTCYSRERARRNRPANQARFKTWYAANRDRSVAAATQWQRLNPGAHRAHVLRYRYGMTVEQEQALLAAQGNVCAVCRQPFQSEPRSRRLAVDHDHDTGEVRGLLHVTCNSGLGMLRHSPEVLARAIEYLSQPPAREVL